MLPPSARGRWLKLAVGLLLLAGVVALLLADVHRSLDPAAMRERLLGWGPWGPAAFLLAFAVLQPVGVSAHAFIVAATLVWSPFAGMLLSWAGVLASSTTSFWFGRWMGREWVQSRLPARLRRWDGALEDHGFRTVLVMRLLLFTLGPMQLMLGVSKVRFGSYLAATAIGVLPVVAIESYIGGAVVDWLFG
ncbi:MAG: TVP38/TMEM64 family protein [Deltaproteobacteria bacterium]|nr:TVP38/TMEM64 family protein [Nannocystaceae bacterium]